MLGAAPLVIPPWFAQGMGLHVLFVGDGRRAAILTSDCMVAALRSTLGFSEGELFLFNSQAVG